MGWSDYVESKRRVQRRRVRDRGGDPSTISDGRRRGQTGIGTRDDPIRRETAAERQTRERRERLQSLQRDLSKTGTVLTEAESQAILQGSSVEQVRSQISQRVRKESLRRLQQDLSRTNVKLSQQEVNAILEGADVQQIREQAFTREQRDRLARERAAEKARQERLRQITLTYLEKQRAAQREQRASQSISPLGTRGNQTPQQILTPTASPEQQSQVRLYTSEQLRTLGRGYELQRRTERLSRAQQEYFRRLGLEGDGVLRGAGRAVASVFNPALFGATLAAGAESAAYIREYRKTFGTDAAPTNVQLAWETGRQTGRVLTLRDPVTGDFTPESVTSGVLIYGTAGLGVLGVRGGARSGVRSPGAAEAVLGTETTLRSGTRVRTVSARADQPAAIINPQTQQYLARFPTGDSNAPVQQTLMLRADRNVRRVSPQEALRLQERPPRMDEARQIIPEPTRQAPFDQGRATNTFETPYGPVEVTRPTRQQSLLSYDDFSPPPPRTALEAFEQTQGRIRSMFADRRGQITIQRPTRPTRLPPEFTSPLPASAPPAPAVNLPSAPTTPRAPPITMFLGQIPRQAPLSPITEQVSNLQLEFDRDVRPAQRQLPELQPIVSVENPPIVDVTPRQRQRPRSGTRTRQRPATIQDPIQIQEPRFEPPRPRQIPDLRTPQRTPPRTTTREQPPRIPPPPVRRNLPDRAPRNILPRFRVTVGRPGNLVYRDFGVGGEELIKRARQLVEGGAAASFRVTGSNVQPRAILARLGTSFRASKRDPFTFVQRRERRLSSPGELLEVGGRSRRSQGFKLPEVRIRL